MDFNIQIFENERLGKVRVVQINGQPWWVLKDVCSALDLKTPHKVAERLDEDERNQIPLIDNVGRAQKTTIITESGLYAVILRSDKPNAKDFRKWITSCVLPSIRRHGAYANDEILKKMRESEEFTDALVARLVKEKMKNGTLATFASLAIPKVQYHDAVLQSPDAVQVSIIAKDYAMSGRAFNKLLRRLGVQFRIGNTWLLYKKHQGKGYTVTNTYTKNGVATIIHTCWTQRGRHWLYGLLKSRGILPEAERRASGGR